MTGREIDGHVDAAEHANQCSKPRFAIVAFVTVFLAAQTGVAFSRAF
jgi:hypothetical protein